MKAKRKKIRKNRERTIGKNPRHADLMDIVILGDPEYMAKVLKSINLST